MAYKKPVGVRQLQKRISGPFLDRMDIHIEVPKVDYEKVSGDRTGEMPESIRVRVQNPRDFSKNSSRTIAHPTSSTKRGWR